MFGRLWYRSVKFEWGGEPYLSVTAAQPHANLAPTLLAP
jgi:hypothetical protein